MTIVQFIKRAAHVLGCIGVAVYTMTILYGFGLMFKYIDRGHEITQWLPVINISSLILIVVSILFISFPSSAAHQSRE